MTDNDPAPPVVRDTAPDTSTDSERHRGDKPQPRSKSKLGARSGPMRLLGLGTELAGFTLIFLGAGYFVDSVRAHQTPYATAFGTMIGFTLGMIRFILQVNKIAEEVTIAPQVTDETDEVNKVNEADEVNEVNDDTKQD